tara:strand:+ start:1819 stop:2790 length:972 start_codon:yes stop_codon:yes gene_type:complete
MNYSFFGTCANDSKHLVACIKTIKDQSLLPKSVVIVDSGTKNQEKELLALISNKKIKLVYLFQDLPRVKALNLAINKTQSDYLIRFDTRTRFSKDYAKNALKIMIDSNRKFVGGVPLVIPENKKFISLIAAGIMSRAYIFFYPRHRIEGYTGYSSSVYLGCFEAEILKNTMYSDEINIISEDSLLATNLSKKGFPPYISDSIKIKYVARGSLKNIFKLFRTYGFARANTLIGFRKLHSFKRYLMVFLSLIFYFIFVPLDLFQKVLIFPLLILTYNVVGEIFYKKTNIIYAFLGTACQISWFLGFIFGFAGYFKVKNEKTNFIS